MKVLVTGATGFIGGRLCLELSSKGHEVLATGRLSQASESFKDYIHYLSSTLEDHHELLELTKGCDAVLHCAGKTGVWGPYQEYYQANVEVTKRLLKAAKENGVQRFIHLSSPSIYFQLKDQMNLKEEDIPSEIFDSYGQTKYESEKLVLSQNDESFLTIAFRPRGVIGAGDKSWLPRIVELYQSGQLIIPGKGDNVVDFTSCHNLVALLIRCLELPSDVFGEVYNITNGAPVPLWPFVKKTLGVLGIYHQDRPLKKLPRGLVVVLSYLSEFWHKLIQSKSEPKVLPLKVGVASYSMTLNIDKATSRLGYSPKQTLDEAVEEYRDWLNKTHSSP